MAQNLNQNQINAEIAIIHINDEASGLNFKSGFDLEEVFNYVSNFAPDSITNNFTAYKIKKDANLEPFKTLNRINKNINGIYFGFGRSIGFRPTTVLYMAPIFVNTVFDTTDNHNYTQTYHFFKENNNAIAFRSIDPNQGIWELTTMEILKPLIEKHRKSFIGKALNRRFGFYVGKLAFENTFHQTNNETYVYLGKGLQLNPNSTSNLNLLQLFFTDKPYFQQNPTINETIIEANKKTKIANNQLIKVACTIGSIDLTKKIIPQNGTPPNQPHNHSTIRPCPTVCPQ